MLGDIETVSSLRAHIPFDVDSTSPMVSVIDAVSSIPVSSIPDSIPFNMDTADDSSLENISISAATVSSGKYKLILSCVYFNPLMPELNS